MQSMVVYVSNVWGADCGNYWHRNDTWSIFKRGVSPSEMGLKVSIQVHERNIASIEGPPHIGMREQDEIISSSGRPK